VNPYTAIARLDRFLVEQGGEWFTLRRIVGTGNNLVNVDVRCFGKIDAISPQEIADGISMTVRHFIISPTQINDAQWPGGTPPAPPFNVDQRIPRMNQDKVIAGGRLQTIDFVNDISLQNVLVRINFRAIG